MNLFSLLIFLVVSSWSLLLHTQVTKASGSLISPWVNGNHETISIGAIFDETSRPGKEAKVAIEMVVHDFNSVSNQYLLLHSGNSHGRPVRAALSGKISVVHFYLFANLFLACRISFADRFQTVHTWDVTTRKHGKIVTKLICYSTQNHYNQNRPSMTIT